MDQVRPPCPRGGGGSSGRTRSGALHAQCGLVCSSPDVNDPRPGGSRPASRGEPCRSGKRGWRLDRFDEREQCTLVNWGYAISDAALRSFVVGPTTPAPEATWPFPEYPLDAGPTRGIRVDEDLDLDPVA